MTSVKRKAKCRDERVITGGVGGIKSLKVTEKSWGAAGVRGSCVNKEQMLYEGSEEMKHWRVLLQRDSLQR